MCHQVHLAVRALPQLTDVFILLGYICCRQRGDGQGLHVLHRHCSTVTHLGCRGAPAAAHPSWPRWRKRQARLDAVGQTKWRGEKNCLAAVIIQVCVHDRMLFSIVISAGGHPYIPVCTSRPKGWLNQEGFNRPSFPSVQGMHQQGNAFSKCIGLPAIPLDHSGQLSDMACLRQHLLADSYGENQYDQVEGLTNEESRQLQGVYSTYC